jgi:hypothetical protein
MKQFEPQVLSNGAQGEYPKYFSIPKLPKDKNGLNIDKKNDYDKCLYNTQGEVQCKSWIVTRDGYSKFVE